jgi:hypothetical protein
MAAMEEGACPICLLRLERPAARLLPCGHGACAACLVTTHLCPLCQTPFRTVPYEETVAAVRRALPWAHPLVPLGPRTSTNATAAAGACRLAQVHVCMCMPVSVCLGISARCVYTPLCVPVPLSVCACVYTQLCGSVPVCLRMTAVVGRGHCHARRALWRVRGR